MQNMTRSLVLAVALLLFGVSAFAAGFLTNDVVESTQSREHGGGVNSDGESFALVGEAWEWVERSYIGEIPGMRQVSYGAIRGALGVLGDPYTVFIEPPAREEERVSLRGNFGGIGATIARTEAGDVVLDPLPDNPAEEAGIEAGDILLAVDGVAIGPEMTVGEIVDLIRGETGTEVTLTVQHEEGGEPVDITVVRADILVPSVSYEILPEAPRVGYIRLSRFSGESSTEVQAAVSELMALGAEQLVLDLRGNGGGLLDAGVDVADLFLEGGVILYQERQGGEEQVYEADDQTVAPTLPLVVLVDHGTASSSEIVAGALQDRGRAVLVGLPTFGKGSVQLVYDLSDGSSVHVTSARWLTPDRRQIDQQGLEPDITVEVTQEAIDDGRDVVLESALNYLQNGSDS